MSKKKEKSNMETWAEEEIRIAQARERSNSKNAEEWDYGCAIYDSALKAFNSLCDDGHSGFSIGVTKQILNRLIDGQCLTPIEDVPEVWNDITAMGPDGKISYQCKRMSALFKDVYQDGRVEYHYTDLCFCQDVNNPNNTYHSGLVSKVIHEMYPITMPYLPPAKPIKVICTDFLSDSKKGNFDTLGILCCIKPDGERVDINRYFGDRRGKFEEISLTSYENRWKKAAKLEKTREEQKNEKTN